MPTLCENCGAELNTAPQKQKEVKGPCENCASDVIIQSKKQAISHKMKSHFQDPENFICWWEVNGKPQKTMKGKKILFSDGEEVFAKGTILEVEEERITFEPLEKTSEENPVEPPTRGFKYLIYDD